MVRKLYLALLLAAALGGAYALSLAQSLVDADDLSVGDRFRLEIKADAPLRQALVPDTLASFHVLSAEKPGKGPDGYGLALTIVPLLPGTQSFPSLEVIPEVPDGQRHFTDRFRVKVIPVRAEGDTALADIKPLEKYPMQLPLWAYGLALALIAAGILFLLLNRSRQAVAAKTEPEPEQAPAIPDPTWKLALQALDELRAEGLTGRGEYILHHYRLSMILRQFLEKKYRFAAGEMTTSEILWTTRRVWVDNAPEVLSFLRYCDKVKFAKYPPTHEEVWQAEEWLRGWLKSFEVMEAQQKLEGGGGVHA
jgi:hypothetical protein